MISHPRLLCINFGNITREQIKDTFKQIFLDYLIKTKWHFKVNTDSDGITCGNGYIWLSNTKALHILIHPNIEIIHKSNNPNIYKHVSLRINTKSYTTESSIYKSSYMESKIIKPNVNKLFDNIWCDAPNYDSISDYDSNFNSDYNYNYFNNQIYPIKDNILENQTFIISQCILRNRKIVPNMMNGKLNKNSMIRHNILICKGENGYPLPPWITYDIILNEVDKYSTSNKRPTNEEIKKYTSNKRLKGYPSSTVREGKEGEAKSDSSITDKLLMILSLTSHKYPLVKIMKRNQIFDNSNSRPSYKERFAVILFDIETMDCHFANLIMHNWTLRYKNRKFKMICTTNR